MIGLFKLSISSWFNFGGYMFLETSVFLLDYQICWHLIVHNIPLQIFCISVVSITSFLCHFLFYLFGFSLFSSQWAWTEIVHFVHPFKEATLDLLFFFLNYGFYVCMYVCSSFWLHRVFVAVCRLSLVLASKGYSLLRCTGFSLLWLLVLQSTGSRHTAFSSCCMRA